MSYKVGERIAVKNITVPLQEDGKPVEVLLDVTTVLKAHVIAQIICVSKGFAFAVKHDGNHEIVKADKASKGSQLLQAGDITALPFADIVPAPELSEPAPRQLGLTREEVKKRLKLQDETLDKWIRGKHLTPDPDGTFSPREVATLATVMENVDREQRRSGDATKEFNRLGRQLHPEIFERPW